MFHPLPANTVFEAQSRNRRDTILLFLLLVVLYIVFFNLIALALFGDFGRVLFGVAGRGVPGVTLAGWISAIAVAIAFFHFIVARSKSLEDLLKDLGAKAADPKDHYHQVFINLVAEAEAATGIRPIRAVLIPSYGCNAFSVADGKGNSAIGVTEGLLSRLDRAEMSAVIAHEASHLVNGDSRLMTTACALFGILGAIRQGLGQSASRSSRSGYRTRGSGGGRMVLAWFMATLGYFLTKMICMALSRTREYLADEHAVQICKDPLALAQALSKVAGKYRGGGGDVNEGYAPLFIMNPNLSNLDEGTNPFADLLSTHPPLQARLRKLMGFARMDLGTFQQQVEGKLKRDDAADASRPSQSPERAGDLFYANREGEWFGPSTPQQLLAAGLLTPQAWICPSGGQEVVRACDVPNILPILQILAPKVDNQHACPRCRMPLMGETYEGMDVLHCTFCKGYLLKVGYVERIMARREVKFDANEIEWTRKWRDAQRGTLRENCIYPEIRCPACKDPMSKVFHSLVSRVIIDRCTNGNCRAIWCDGGELETLQMLVEGDSAAVGF